MTWQTRHPVLVGVDGRAGGMHALGFGAAEAVIRRARYVSCAYTAGPGTRRAAYLPPGTPRPWSPTRWQRC
jgi:hypothetical protein